MNTPPSANSPGTGPAGAPDPSAVPRVPDHELLRRIGRGSYGEVWLARNILGEYRAVKVIYRRAFEHDRPYEREVEGIRRFEPVSRAHPSQLNVLHVGRNDAGGYFYYVMELADDASANPKSEVRNPNEVRNPKSEPVAAGADAERPANRGTPSDFGPRNSDLYVPHTLKHDLDQRGRLPVEECLRIGLALTTALEHLHAHGLVHRDVKPSNIIYIHGVPKLADIGLVANMDATMSFVGTSGFLPPEGPGTPKGDLYSLGKVLYEASTGRDRQEFPKLPVDFAEWPDATRLVELNAVILKACAHDPRQRYQTAHEMAADLLLLQRGQSVRRLRWVERRLAFVSRAGAVVSALLLVAAGLYWNAVRQERATARQLYVADMNRALRAWEGGNVGLARELLETHRRRQPDMLGFEWRLIARLCQESDAQFTLRGHERTVSSVAFSPDGKTLATGGADRTVKLWDAATGKLRTTLSGHQATVGAVAFSPDGRRLATGSRDRTVKLWDLQSLSEDFTLAGHTDAVRSVAFSLDGKMLVTSGEDKVLRWWNLARTQEIARVPAGITVEHITFSPDGRRLAGCGGDTRVHFWNAATREEEIPLELHQAIILSVAYSADGRMLASGSYDGTIKLWDLVERRELAALGRGAPVRGVAFAPGGKFLAAATEDGLVRLWDVARHEVLSTLRGHDANVRAIAFSPDGRQLATGGEDGVAKLWDVSTEPGRENALKHAGIVNGLTFSPDGKILATTDCVADRIRLWAVESQQEVAAVQAASNAVWCIAFAPDGTALATGGIDRTVRVWNPTNLSEVAVFKGHTEGVDAIAFSPDGRFIVSGGRDQTARLWDRHSGRELAAFATAGGLVRAVAFSPDGKTLVTGGLDGRLWIWDLDSRREQARLDAHQGEIRALAFSPDGRMLVSGGADRTIRVWDARRRVAQATLAGHGAIISSLAFSPDGKTLASGSWDSVVKLWNVRLFREVAALESHSGQITQVAFAPDGNTLASASADGTVRLWRATPGLDAELHPDTGSHP